MALAFLHRCLTCFYLFSGALSQGLRHFIVGAPSPTRAAPSLAIAQSHWGHMTRCGSFWCTHMGRHPKVPVARAGGNSTLQWRIAIYAASLFLGQSACQSLGLHILGAAFQMPWGRSLLQKEERKTLPHEWSSAHKELWMPSKMLYQVECKRLGLMHTVTDCNSPEHCKLEKFLLWLWTEHT